MKTIYILLASFFLAFTGFVQDTVQGQVNPADTIRADAVRVDTVWVEKVKVDTVWIEKVKVEPTQEKVQEPSTHAKESKKKGEKVYKGGYANFSFGKYTLIGFEPLIAYKLLPKFSVGGKISYEYVKDNRYDITHEGSNYGFGVFSRLRIGKRLYAHIEYSKMNYKLYDSQGDSERNWISFLYLGGGISLPISNKVSFNAEILWDLNQDDDSPYKTVQPFVNIGVGVGF